MADEKKGNGAVVLVTGASGFVAGYTIQQLLERGYKVRSTVRSLKDAKKFAHLMNLPGAKENLELFEANLLDAGSFDKPCEGCTYVLHLASPYTVNAKDPQKDLVDPAVKGTVSVLTAAKKANVKRVVVTSSMAAVTDEPDLDKASTEDDWNDKSSLTRNPYYYSKVLAERAAWDFSKEHNLDVVVVNPAVILGPSMTKDVNESVQALMVDIHNPIKFPAVMNFGWGIVDVRDVALAHIKAMENPNAKGRYLTSGQNLTMREVVEIVREKYPNVKLPTMDWSGGIGTFMAKASSYLQPGQVGQYIRTNIARPMKVDNSKIKKELGMQFRDSKATIIETEENLMFWGHLPDLRKVQLSPEETKNIEEALRGQKGLVLADHSCILSKKHPNSFLGKEAVTWLLENRPNIHSRDSAVRLAEALFAAGVFKSSEDSDSFKDSGAIYQLR